MPTPCPPPAHARTPAPHLAQEEHRRLLRLHHRRQLLQAEAGARLRLQLNHLGAKAAGHVGHARALPGRGGGRQARGRPV